MGYEYYRTEPTNESGSVYKEGYFLYSSPFFDGFKDFTINKGNALLLTDAISLTSLFVNDTFLVDDLLFASVIKISPRNSSNNYAAENQKHQIILSNSPQNFELKKIDNNTTFIITNEKYLQISPNYPYEITTSTEGIPDSELYLRTFNYYYNNGFITFSILTPEGYRYLNFGTDGILRATGVAFNENDINGYLLAIISNTQKTNTSINASNYFRNDWIRYFMDLKDNTNNKNTKINTIISNPPTNYLVSFPINNVTSTNEVNINIANLKTNYTPTGANGIEIEQSNLVGYLSSIYMISDYSASTNDFSDNNGFSTIGQLPVQYNRTLYTNPYTYDVIATVSYTSIDDCLMINDSPVGTPINITWGSYIYRGYTLPPSGYSFSLSASETFSIGIGNLVDRYVGITGGTVKFIHNI